MAEKTLIEKAAKAVGFGIAMAEDVADTVRTAVDAAVTTVTGVLKTSSATETSVSSVVRKPRSKNVEAKASASRTIKKLAPKAAGLKSSDKKAAKKITIKKTGAKKQKKKVVKKSRKKSLRTQNHCKEMPPNGVR
jgi:hypothetical protein